MNPREMESAVMEKPETAVQELEYRRERLLDELASVVRKIELQSEAIAVNPEKVNQGTEGNDFEQTVLGRMDSANSRISALLERLIRASSHIERCVGNGIPNVGTAVQR